MKFTKFGKVLLMSALSVAVVLSITSCVQSYTVGFLYVTGTTTAQPNGNGIISGFRIDHNTGKLTSINGLPISSGGANPVRAVLTTGSRFLYVLNRGISQNPAGSSICTTAYPCSNGNIHGVCGRRQWHPHRAGDLFHPGSQSLPHVRRRLGQLPLHP